MSVRVSVLGGLRSIVEAVGYGSLLFLYLFYSLFLIFAGLFLRFLELFDRRFVDEFVYCLFSCRPEWIEENKERVVRRLTRPFREFYYKGKTSEVLERNKVLVFDVETTGLNAERCSVLGFSCVLLENGKPVKKLSRYYYPEEGAEISPVAIEVNGLTNEAISEKRKGVSYPKYFREDKEIVDLFKEANIIVSHNIKLDWAFATESHKELKRLEKEKVLYCTMLKSTWECCLYRYWGNEPKWPKLKEAVEILKITPPKEGEYHDPEYDVLYTAELFKKLLALGWLSPFYKTFVEESFSQNLISVASLIPFCLNEAKSTSRVKRVAESVFIIFLKPYLQFLHLFGEILPIIRGKDFLVEFLVRIDDGVINALKDSLKFAVEKSICNKECVELEEIEDIEF
jgi:DNA polymerase III epsilon subunit-like protein